MVAGPFGRRAREVLPWPALGLMQCVRRSDAAAGPVAVATEAAAAAAMVAATDHVSLVLLLVTSLWGSVVLH